MSLRTSHVSMALLIVAVLSGSLVIALVYNSLRSAPPETIREIFPVTIKDDLGREIIFKQTPNRIVSLVPSSTQIVFALGAGQRIVGVTRFDDQPAELLQLVNSGRISIVGGGFDPDVERIIQLRADLVLANGPTHVNSKPVQRLAELGFPILALNPKSVKTLLDDIHLMGLVLERADEARIIVTGIEETIQLIQSKTTSVPKIKVYIENWHDPLFSVGQETLQHDMLTIVGAENIFSDLRGSAQVNPEAVIARNPEVILNFNNLVSPEDIRARPGWQSINAVRTSRIYQMQPHEGAPNPRIGGSLLRWALLIYPERFQQSSLSVYSPLPPHTPIIPIALAISLVRRK